MVVVGSLFDGCEAGWESAGAVGTSYGGDFVFVLGDEFVGYVVAYLAAGLEMGLSVL